MQLTFFSLGSGSCGNCYYLATESDAIIIDCGVSSRRLKKNFLEYGLKISKVRSVFVTHDHADHIKAAGKLSAGHARTLLALKDRDMMLPMAKLVIELDLSVRRLEDEVKKANRPKKSTEDEDEAPVYVDYLREMELRIQRTIGRRVKIEDGKRKKTLTLYYEDNEDLDELLRALCGDEFFEEA